MKKAISVLALSGLVLFASSCAQRTCPAYSKDVLKEKKVDVRS